MLFFYIIILGFLLRIAQRTEAAAFTTPSRTAIQLQTARVETLQNFFSLSETPKNIVSSQRLTSLSPIPRVTPPPSPNHLDLRQRCWNDQGFSVDCAVWTGYRYTWGPASNPYDYWSGGGGSGSGGGGVVPSDARKARLLPSSIAAALALIITYASLA
jgi:hypothetical protein